MAGWKDLFYGAWGQFLAKLLHIRVRCYLPEHIWDHLDQVQDVRRLLRARFCCWIVDLFSVVYKKDKKKDWTDPEGRHMPFKNIYAGSIFQSVPLTKVLA